MAVSVVLVDDHQIVRDGIRLRLNRVPDIQVSGEAGSAAEAYQQVRCLAPDLVILDLALPDEPGISALDKIKALCPHAKVIVLTGDARGRTVDEALRAGADGFVRKESAGDSLITAIHTIMGGKTFLCPLAATALVANLREQEQVGSAGPVLSARESRLLQGIAGGLSYKELARQLNVTVKSVETYRSRLAKKLGLTTRAEFVRYAAGQGAS